MSFLNYLTKEGYPIELLDSVLENKEEYTYFFRIKNKAQIAPKWELKIAQKILKKYISEIYSKSMISQNATAYISGKNISYNLERHQGNNYFFTTDFNNFFPSISIKSIQENVVNLFNKDDDKSKQYIMNIISYKNKLQYGFPTSPIISNMVMQNFDNKLQEKLTKVFPDNNIQYTRYSDDITISSKYKIEKYKILETISEIINNGFEYLTINQKKTRYFEKYAKTPYITGLVPLSKRNTIGKKKFNKIKLNIYLLLNNKNIINKDLFKDPISLSSYLSYIYLVDRHNYSRLKKTFLNYQNTTQIFNNLFTK